VLWRAVAELQVGGVVCLDAKAVERILAAYEGATACDLSAFAQAEVEIACALYQHGRLSAKQLMVALGNAWRTLFAAVRLGMGDAHENPPPVAVTFRINGNDCAQGDG